MTKVTFGMLQDRKEAGQYGNKELQCTNVMLMQKM